MFSILRKILPFSSLFSSKNMSTRSRYFTNPKPDFDAKFSPQEVPLGDITVSLEKLIERIESHVKPTEENAGDGLYLGTAGIAYMFYHLSKVPALSSKKNEFLMKALEYTKPSVTVAAYVANKKKDVPSFILGNAGIYAVAAAVFNAVGDESQRNQFCKLFYDAANICKDTNFLDCGSDELFVGRTGKTT